MDSVHSASDDLRALVPLVRSLRYPPGIRHVEPGAIRGCAFFPGGTGILVGPDPRRSDPGHALPVRGVMVLGHNFHDVANYEKSVARGDELDTPTWRGLVSALSEFGISHSVCFFTNALMGLMERAGACGTHKGHRDEAFRGGCLRVLAETLAAQQPRLVLALGQYAPRVLAQVVPGLSSWRSDRSFADFDSMRLHEAGLRTLLPGTNVPMACVVITHPCLRDSNVRHRSLDGLVGRRAEIEMVQRAKRSCGFL